MEDDPFAGLDDLKAFALFKHTYNRKYANEEENSLKFKIFQDNLRNAEQLDAKDEYVHFGVTKFMDVSRTEFEQTYLMKNFSSPKTRGEDYSVLPTLEDPGQPPAAFDWNAQHACTGVYDQGTCGSCWAFSTTENVESMWSIFGNGLGLLSMQQLVSCDTWSSGCGGGDPPNAFQYLLDVGGQESLANYEYTGQNTPCEFNPAGIKARISGYGYVTRTDNEPYMEDWIYAYGPPSACVDASQWQYYRGGVFGANCGQSIDHCIQITGWTIIQGVGCWIVRNSWGTDFGYGGYLYVGKGGNFCAIGDEVTSCVI